MRSSAQPAAFTTLLVLMGCARGVPLDGGDAPISGSTDLGALEDIVGINWDDYPDKSSLIDSTPLQPDRPTALQDLGAPADLARPAAGCGIPGGLCCEALRCNRGGECRGGVCAEVAACGAISQPCCGVAACGPGNACMAGRCESMVNCGGSGGPCCASVTPCLSSLLCVSGACVPCGGPGQPCCGGATMCFRGLSCGGGLCRAAM